MPDLDDDALPVKLPATTSGRFGLAAIDYTINQKLQELIPKEANRAVLTVRIKSHGEERLLTGVIATKVATGWGVDLGAALAGAFDLHDRRNYEVEFLGVVDWK